MGSNKKKSSHLHQPKRDHVEELHKEAKAHTAVIYNWLQERRSQINFLTAGKKPPITDALALPRQMHETFIPRFVTPEAKESRLAIKRRKSNRDHWRLIEALREAYDFPEACQKATVLGDVLEEMSG